ncbi:MULTISPECIES: hypothetical protein [unclassified Streptomyces]|uniref:hypothetical protein n=1 Tax=unclassified Streptomyces TaxID=2593676 RepID=UPI003246728C
MYEFEISQIRSADLIRQAQHQRLVREAVLGRRAARREAARRATEDEAHSRRPSRLRSARAA